MTTQAALSWLANSFRREDAVALSQTLLSDLSLSDVQQLRRELQSTSFETITSNVEREGLYSDDPRTNELEASIVRDYFRYLREHDTPPDRGDDTPLARLKRDFKNFDGLTQRLADFYKIPSSDWLSFAVKQQCAHLLKRAGEVDRVAGSGITTISEAAARLLKVLLLTTQSFTQVRINEASPSVVLRASTAFSNANQLFRTYYRVNSMHLFTSVVQPLWALPSLLDKIPKAEAVEYRYWMGRYKLSNGNIHHARELLLLSFKNCHNRSKNKRVIFIYLACASILCGYNPSPALLSAFNLRDQFGPIILHLRRGDAAALRQHLDLWMEWFAMKNILFILREKLDPLVWCTVFKKVALITDKEGYQTKSPELKVPLASIAVALQMSYRDASYDMDDAETIAACLMDQGYLRGGLVHSTNSINRLRVMAPTTNSSLTQFNTTPD
ncbi:hypothetical protein FRB99_004543, partial [Tulasnella sp. 403]